jgi:hypothetical protein
MDTGRFFDAEEALAHDGAVAAGADVALEAEGAPDFVMVKGPAGLYGIVVICTCGRRRSGRLDWLRRRQY